MLEKWKLFNFKSVRTETELEMAPLTIFAGPNSSGKSTFLQSILLVAQTLAHKVSSRSVVLNGSMAKLGQFDDLMSIGSKVDQIVIGWTCRPLEQTAWDIGGRYPRRPYLSQNKLSLSSATCEIAFDARESNASREITQIQPLLFNSKLSVATRDSRKGDQDYSLTIQISEDDKDVKQKWVDAAEENGSMVIEGLRYDVSLDQQSLEDLQRQAKSGIAIGCLLHHFRPIDILLGVDMVIEDAQAILKDIASGALIGGLVRRSPDQDIRVPDSVVDSVLKVAEDTGKDSAMALRSRIEAQRSDAPFGSEPISLDVLAECLDQLGSGQGEEIRRRLSRSSEFTTLVYQAVSADRSEQLRVVPHPLPRVIRTAYSYINRFFSSHIKYLGPLRDEPKSLYPLSLAVDPSDVGLKGEQTAAVLDLHKNRRIQYIPTDAFTAAQIHPEPVKESLEVAVIDWLRYLGVAEGVESRDKGKFGHELTVQIAEAKGEHDLTHVGVGVSQVLPILVTSLLSDADTTMVFEQPELHLHPKVQTLLADFFLSVTQLGKQCVIETHSEYIINRIRFRIAAAGAQDPWLNAVKVYFVDRDERGSSFRSIDINEYGAILEWPDGFFDQSQMEADAIIQAASIKRKARRRN